MIQGFSLTDPDQTFLKESKHLCDSTRFIYSSSLSESVSAIIYAPIQNESGENMEANDRF